MIALSMPVSAETLRVFGWEGYLYEQYQQPFIAMVKEQHGVDLQFEYHYVETEDELFPALRDNQADIVTPSHYTPKDERYRLIELKLVAPLNLQHIPNYQHILPSWQQSEFWTVGDQVYGIPFANGLYGLVYNTTRLATAPDSWNVFWNPEFKDQYSIGRDLYEEHVYMTALAMGISPDNMSDYKTVNTPELQEKLAQLAVNAHSLWVGVETVEDLQGLAFATAWGGALPGLKAIGEEWAFADPKEGTIGYNSAFMLNFLLQEQPLLKQIAEEWCNYVLTDALQASNIRDNMTYPVTTTVKNVLTPEEIAQFHLDDPTYFEKHVVFYPFLSKLDRKGLKRLWDEALAKRK